MIGHLWNVYYATSNWLIGTASVLNVLLLTTQAKAMDFLSHPPERVKRDCIKTQIKVNSLILSDLQKYGNEVVYDILLYSSLFVCLRLLLSYLYTLLRYSKCPIYLLEFRSSHRF